MNFSSTRLPVTVLVIDDVRDTADSLADYLRAAHEYVVRVATDGATGLKWAAADPPDAVVCDLGLPGLDGLKVAEQLRDAVSPAPFLIAVTGFSGTDAATGPFDAYLVKPADPARIAALVGRFARQGTGTRGGGCCSRRPLKRIAGS
jgi:two-component system, OmpR family, response regulator